MPASSLYFLTRYATAGVGTIPARTACAPTEHMPAVSAASSISPDILVSIPTSILGV